eukprot:5180972-Prymnesium_polylepis.1
MSCRPLPSRSITLTTACVRAPALRQRCRASLEVWSRWTAVRTMLSSSRIRSRSFLFGVGVGVEGWGSGRARSWSGEGEGEGAPVLVVDQ